MKALIIILLSSIVGYAQPFTFNDIPFLGQTTTAAAFSPSDVAGLVMWYKADAIAGKSVGDLVTNWNDSSSSGYTLQNTAANQQPFYSNNVSRLNGKPWLVFDGTDDKLDHGYSTVYNQPLTWFCVAWIDVFDSGRTILSGTNSASRIKLGAQTSRRVEIYAGAQVLSAVNGIESNRWYLMECTFTNGGSGILTNGVTLKSGDSGTTYPLSGFRVGNAYSGSTYFMGGIAEILVYNADVSSGDRTSIRTYFTGKYGAYSSW